MRSRTSVLNKGYFTFLLKKTWGIAVAFAVLSVIGSFFGMLFNSVSDEIGSYFGVSGDTVSVVLLDDSLKTGLFFMGAFCLVLCLSMFGVLYNRSSCDFVGCAPVSRVSIHLTSCVLGVLYVVALTLLSALFTALLGAGSGYLAFGEIVRYAVLLFAGSLVLFALSSLCASVASNGRGFLLFSVVTILCVPLTITLLQQMFNPTYENSVSVLLDLFTNAGKSDNVIYEVMPVLYPLSLHSGGAYPSAALDVLLSFLYSVALSVGYFAIGALCMKKRRFEITEKSFEQEKWMNILLGLLVLPVILMQYVSYGVGISVFFVGILFLGIAILVRKGLGKLWQSVLVYVCVLVVSFALSAVAGVLEPILPVQSMTTDEIACAESVTLTIPYDDVFLTKGNRLDGKTVTLTDRTALKAFAESCKNEETGLSYSAYSYSYATINSADGKEMKVAFVYNTFSDSFRNLTGKTPQQAFLAARDDAPLDTPIAVFLEAYGTGESVAVDITSSDIISLAVSERAAFRALSAEERAEKLEAYSTVTFGGSENVFSGRGRTLLSAVKGTVFLRLITYRDGCYYTEIVPVDKDSEAFETIWAFECAKAEEALQNNILEFISFNYPLVEFSMEDMAKDIVADLIAAAKEQYRTCDIANYVTLNGEGVVLFCDPQPIAEKFIKRKADTVEDELKQLLDNKKACNINIIDNTSNNIIFYSDDYCEDLFAYALAHYDETCAIMAGNDSNGYYTVNVYVDSEVENLLDLLNYEYTSFDLYLYKEHADRELFETKMADIMKASYHYTSAEIAFEGKTATLTGEESADILQNITDSMGTGYFYSQSEYVYVTVTIHYDYKEDVVLSGNVPRYMWEGFDDESAVG